MDNRIIFREILGDIRRAADEAGGVITKEEIKERLSHLPLGEDHLKMIYQYLSEQGIQVPDDAQEAAELPTGEEGFALSIYLEELQQLLGKLPEGAAFVAGGTDWVIRERKSTQRPPALVSLGSLSELQQLAEREDEDETELLKAVAAGEAQAREKLIRWYLPLICEMAGEYKGDEIAAEDLIQEGNVGLLMAMESLNEFENAAASQAHLLNSVNEAMQAAIHANEETKKRNEDVVSQVNHLDEAIKNLERDLERKVSAEELSAYLDMPLEQIRDILNISGDQIEVDGRK